jgi:hypothetical protein
MKTKLIKQIIKVEWEDSATYKEWYNFEELNLLSNPCLIKSIGYLVDEDKKFILLAMNIDDNSCSCITQIPKKSI